MADISISAFLDDADSGTPYTRTVTATGGTPPYRYLVTAGVLPPGLSLDRTTGIISGTTPVSLFTPNLTHMDAGEDNDEGNTIEFVWESGLVRGVNDFAVRFIRVGNLDVWVRGNGELLTQVFGPEKRRRVIPPLLDRQGESATLTSEPGSMFQEKFDLAHVENWTVRFSTAAIGHFFELSEFVGYQRADLANK